MLLSLQPDEAALLAQALKAHLANLRAEISGTDHYGLRQALKRDAATLAGILERLPAPGPAGAAQAAPVHAAV